MIIPVPWRIGKLAQRPGFPILRLLLVRPVTCTCIACVSVFVCAWVCAHLKGRTGKRAGKVWVIRSQGSTAVKWVKSVMEDTCYQMLEAKPSSHQVHRKCTQTQSKHHLKLQASLQLCFHPHWFSWWIQYNQFAATFKGQPTAPTSLSTQPAVLLCTLLGTASFFCTASDCLTFYVFFFQSWWQLVILLKRFSLSVSFMLLVFFFASHC